jgi:hypothetical protein
MNGVTVTRWTRYGQDRLYVSTEDEKLGWHDLLTGENHPSRPELATALHQAVVGWRAMSPTLISDATAEAPAPHVSVQRAPAPGPVDDLPTDTWHSDQVLSAEAEEANPGWTDLAQQRAGALAREQALAAREAAPVRTFVARALGVHTDERAWRIGADGEEKVAGRLAKLLKKDPRWQVIHAVPVGENGSDIDHVVIGPGGVFTLNAKHHPRADIWVGGNTFMVNGHRQPYVRNSRHEASRAARLLSTACGFPVPVTGVVVPVGADTFTVRTPPVDVVVINRMAVDGWLRRRPEVLSPEQVAAVFEAARRSTTWRPLPRQSSRGASSR